MPKPMTMGTEVVASSKNDKRQRRRFSAEYKARILAEADACSRGELGELLRREGLYSSHITVWRKQREAEGRAGLEPRKPGPKPAGDEKDLLIAKLERKAAQLEKENRIQKALLELQGKAAAILGVALPRVEENESDDSSSSSDSAPPKSR